MNIPKRIAVGLLFVSFTASKSVAQSVFIGWGPVHSHTKQTQRLVNSKDAWSYVYTQIPIGVEVPLKRFSGLLSLTSFNVLTDMRVGYRYYSGYAGTRITRVDLGVSYNLIKPNKLLFIKPFFAAGLQFAKYEADIWGEQVHIYGPDYFQTEYPTSQGRSNFQVVPGLGVRMGIKFLKRMEFGVCIQGVYGYKRFQELTFKYNYRDELTERTAKFESNGTGLYSNFFLGINLKKRER